MVDGGLDYLKRSYITDQWEELSETLEIASAGEYSAALDLLNQMLHRDPELFTKESGEGRKAELLAELIADYERESVQCLPEPPLTRTEELSLLAGRGRAAFDQVLETGRTYRPAEVFPPGEFLRDEILARGLLPEVVQKALSLDEGQFEELLTGRLELTEELAFLLAAGFGTSSEYWMNLERAWRSRESKL